MERYVSTTGEVIAWVKLPSLSGTTDTSIYMYYGNSGASDQSSATTAWDTNTKLLLICLTGPLLQQKQYHWYERYCNRSNRNQRKIDGAGNFDGINDQIDYGNVTGLTASLTQLTVFFMD